MRHKHFLSFVLLHGLVAGAGLMFDGLPIGPTLTWAAEEQTAPPARSTEQPEATERGLPGQAFPQLPGLAIPGSQPLSPKVRLLPKLPGSAPPPPPKELGAGQKPGALPKHSPGLGEIVNAYRLLPGGAEAWEDAMRRGFRDPFRAAMGTRPSIGPRRWSVTIWPEVPTAPDPVDRSRNAASLRMTGINLRADWGNGYFLRSKFGYYDPRDGSFRENKASRVTFHVTVPRDGWYMLNIEVQLVGGSQYACFVLMDNRERPIHGFYIRERPLPTGPLSLPYLVELEAGLHTFQLDIGGAYCGDVYAQLLEASLMEFEP